QVGTPVDRGSLEPGDLVFFGHPVHHEGIYIGGGKFIHAPHTGDVVKISSLDEPWYANGFAGARRVAGLADGGVQPLQPGVEPEAPSTGDSGVFAALDHERRDVSSPPHSTVQFLPAVTPEDEQQPSE